MEKKVPKFSCPEKKLMSRDSYRDLLWKILTSSWSTFHFYSDGKGRYLHEVFCKALHSSICARVL